MALPWIRRRTHEAILRVTRDQIRAEMSEALGRWARERAQLERAHADAIDRIRGRLSPRTRDAVDRLLDNARYSAVEPR